MESNPLSPSAILQGMADALPTHPAGDPTSDLSSSHEALALFTHSCMTSLGFRLLGFDEEKTDEKRCRELAPRLPENWNNSVNSYAFVYAHPQSALRFIIKVDRMSAKAEIRGLAIDDDRITRFDITTRDYVSNGALPVRITLKEDGVEDRTGLVGKLQDVFVSDGRISELASLLKINIVQKLVPSLLKEGYEESPDDRAARDDADDAGRRRPQQPVIPNPLPQPALPHPIDDPFRSGPRNPVPAGEFAPPEFEDPYDLNRPARGPFHPGRTPFGDLGADDLNPPGLGPSDPFRPNLGGALRRPGGHRGMHPNFDDPLFGGGIGGLGDEFDPQAPPGARFDPVGPGGLPRLGGRRPGGGNDPFGDGLGGGYGGSGGGHII